MLIDSHFLNIGFDKYCFIDINSLFLEYILRYSSASKKDIQEHLLLYFSYKIPKNSLTPKGTPNTSIISKIPDLI